MVQLGGHCANPICQPNLKKNPEEIWVSIVLHCSTSPGRVGRQADGSWAIIFLLVLFDFALRRKGGVGLGVDAGFTLQTPGSSPKPGGLKLNQPQDGDKVFKEVGSGV